MSEKKTWDDLIVNAETEFGKNSNLANFWRKTKEKAIKNGNKSLREIYMERPIQIGRKYK